MDPFALGDLHNCRGHPSGSLCPNLEPHQRMINMNTEMNTNAMVKSKRPDSCCFVLFGVSGDLSHRLVIPALYNLAEADLLPERFCVIGATRSGVPTQA